MVKMKSEPHIVRVTITNTPDGPQANVHLKFDGLPPQHIAMMLACAAVAPLRHAAIIADSKGLPDLAARTVLYLARLLNENHAGEIPRAALEWFTVIDPSLGAAPEPDHSGDEA